MWLAGMGSAPESRITLPRNVLQRGAPRCWEEAPYPRLAHRIVASSVSQSDLCCGVAAAAPLRQNAEHSRRYRCQSLVAGAACALVRPGAMTAKPKRAAAAVIRWSYVIMASISGDTSCAAAKRIASTERRMRGSSAAAASSNASSSRMRCTRRKSSRARRRAAAPRCRTARGTSVRASPHETRCGCTRRKRRSAADSGSRTTSFTSAEESKYTATAVPD